MYITHDKETDFFYFNCPHCDLMCQIPRNEIRCTIFRHAVFKENMEFVPPHAPQKVCEEWIKNGKVWGCGKPFKFDGVNLSICDYI